MLAHVFKMIWNRKRANALIVSEIAVAFIVVFALVAIGLRYFTLYSVPLGYDYKNMWQVRMFSGKWDPDRDLPVIQQLAQSLNQEQTIEEVHLMKQPPFENWTSRSAYERDGKHFDFISNAVDDGALETMGVELIKGRWFGPQDSGQNYQPVVVNRLFADSYFPAQDPIGQNIANPKGETKEIRIVGVFKEFRQFGELSALSPYLFYRLDINDPKTINNALYHMQLKVKPGTNIAYEDSLMRLLQGIAPDWTFSIRPWNLQRDSQMQETLLPLIVMAIVGVFLILMVAMGLFGVLWQNVTRRTHEIGLRRAIGATASSIHRLIISELLVVSCLAITIASALIVQVPLLGLFPELNWTLFAQSLLVSTAFMMMLAIGCAFYPGKVATQFKPAEALHYE